MSAEQASFLDGAAPAGRPHEYAIPVGATIAHCRSCNAEIVWAHTPTGRAAPLSIATVQTRDGRQYALSHFRDCPDARDWSA